MELLAQRVGLFYSTVLTRKLLKWRVEGESHVRMRRVLSPAFGIKESKALVPLFRESVQTVCHLVIHQELLVDILSTQLIEQLEDSIAQNPHGSYVVNIPTVVGRANFDALGKAAFEYDFGSLRGKNTELEESLHQFTLVSSSSSISSTC